LVGGFLANEGEERRFDSERAAAIQDVRMDEYAAFLGAAQKVFLPNATSSAQPFDPAEWDDLDPQTQEAVIELSVAQARVALICERVEVEEAADALAAVLARGARAAQYTRAGKEFLAEARDEIAVTGE
jgi:hypothetical protein